MGCRAILARAGLDALVVIAEPSVANQFLPPFTGVRTRQSLSCPSSLRAQKEDDDNECPHPDGHPCTAPAGATAVLTTITSLISRGGHESFVAREFERVFGGKPATSHHLTALLVQQENGVSFLISQFQSRRDLEDWRASPERRRMIEAFEVHSLRELCTIDQPVAHITVPSNASGPKWKLFVSSWIVTFPLLLVLVQFFSLLLPDAPLVLRIALTSIAISLAITWLISPLVLKVTRTWRLRHQQMRIEVVETESGRSVTP